MFSGAAVIESEVVYSNRFGGGSTPKAGCAVQLLFQPVIRSLFSDDHIVDVRLTQASGSYANKFALVLKLFDCAATCVAHTGTKPAYQLRRHLRDRAFISDAAFDSFRHQFRFTLRHFLRIPITRALPHRTNRTHAARSFE